MGNIGNCRSWVTVEKFEDTKGVIRITGARGTDLPPPFFSNFLFTNLFSIKFLYFFIISSLFPYFNLFVSIFIQSYVNIKLHRFPDPGQPIPGFAVSLKKKKKNADRPTLDLFDM
jgi:hypothetical protein